MRTIRREVGAAVVLFGLAALAGATPGTGGKAPAPLPREGKQVKGLVALAEVVGAPGKGPFEVRLTLKNVSDRPITVCDCLELGRQVQARWTGPDGKERASKHNHYPGSNYLLGKRHFVVIPPGETRRIVPTVRFHTAATAPGPDGPADRKLGRLEVLDRMVLAHRSNLAEPGEHRVTVSFTSPFSSYPSGRGPRGGPSPDRIEVPGAWTGTVTAPEVTFRAR
jgi:hypothetical protein